MPHDLVIRGGTVVDGTGVPARTADVAIDGDRIVEVGRVEGLGRREIDADGQTVTSNSSKQEDNRSRSATNRATRSLISAS